MVHTLEGLCTHSELIVHAHRMETIKSTYVVCKVIMCPDPFYNNNNNICLKSNIQTSSVDCAPLRIINDYEYNNLKKSEAVLAWKRILK